MFGKEALEKISALNKIWGKKYSDLLEGKQLDLKTDSAGIDIKPVYTPEDLNDIKIEKIGLPGCYPYTRGNYPIQYQTNPFIQYQFFGFGTPGDTQKRRDWLMKLGCSYKVGTEEQMPLLIAFDLPTLNGLDPDDPGARGRVGQGGVSACTVDDIGVIAEGLPLENTWMMWNAFDATLPLYSLYFSYAMDVRKVPLEKLVMHAPNNICNQWCHDWISFPPKASLKLEVEFIKFIIENCPRSAHSVIEGYESAEAGATTIQEVAFKLGLALCITEECKKAGLDPDQVVPGLWGHCHLGVNLLEEIAKIRATRKVWAEVFREKFGCQKPESLMHKLIIAETAGIELTAQEPLNNIVRLALGTLAAILGGAEGIFTAAYDEAHGIPTEESAKMSIRIQQILAEETDLLKVTDPLGGSYYLEWLTDKMGNEIKDLLKKIEERGGYLKCWESGWMREQISISAIERQKKIQSGEKVVVGVNKYQSEDESDIEVFRTPSESEIIAVKKVKKHRGNRDNEKVNQTLKKVGEAAEKIEKEWPRSCGVLMPALLEASRAGATLGEMHKIMKDIFGYDFYSG